MTKPGPILKMHDACAKPPDLNSLSSYRDDGKIPLNFYTDPDYYIRQWIEDQTKMAKDLKKEKKKKKVRRARVCLLRAPGRVRARWGRAMALPALGLARGGRPGPG